MSVSRRRPGKGRGFTVVELMVTIAVLAVVLAIAIPSFLSQIQSGRAQMAADGLKRTIMNARSLAAQSGRHTEVRINASGVPLCGDAAWAVVQPSASKNPVGCLSQTDFAKRYEGASFANKAGTTLTFSPSGLGESLLTNGNAQSSVSYAFTSGSKKSTVVIDAGGSVEVTHD